MGCRPLGPPSCSASRRWRWHTPRCPRRPQPLLPPCPSSPYTSRAEGDQVWGTKQTASLHNGNISHLALHGVGIRRQVLPPAHPRVLGDESLLGHLWDTHGPRKLTGALCCQTRVAGLKRDVVELTCKVPRATSWFYTVSQQIDLYGLRTLSITSLASWMGLAKLRTADTAPLASVFPSITRASISTSPFTLSTDPRPGTQVKKQGRSANGSSLGPLEAF